MLTIHHLNFSRSTRPIWLLEELGLPYKLVKYERDANGRAPDALRAVHPLGKAPVMVDDDLVLAESSAILTYINDHLGGGRFAPKAGTDKRFIHDEWLQYVESSAAFPISITVIGSKLGGLSDGLKRFAEPEVANTLNYISSALTKGPYIMGASPSPTFSLHSRWKWQKAPVCWRITPCCAAISAVWPSVLPTRRQLRSAALCGHSPDQIPAANRVGLHAQGLAPVIFGRAFLSGRRARGILR